VIVDYYVMVQNLSRSPTVQTKPRGSFTSRRIVSPRTVHELVSSVRAGVKVTGWERKAGGGSVGSGQGRVDLVLSVVRGVRLGFRSSTSLSGRSEWRR